MRVREASGEEVKVLGEARHTPRAVAEVIALRRVAAVAKALLEGEGGAVAYDVGWRPLAAALKNLEELT